MLEAVSAVGPRSQSLSRALTEGRQDTGLPVLQRPCTGSHPALFQSRDWVPAQQAATEGIRGEVGVVEWTSHPPVSLF